jgi:hypothetical protein
MLSVYSLMNRVKLVWRESSFKSRLFSTEDAIVVFSLEFFFLVIFLAARFLRRSEIVNRRRKALYTMTDPKTPPSAHITSNLAASKASRNCSAARTRRHVEIDEEAAKKYRLARSSEACWVSTGVPTTDAVKRKNKTAFIMRIRRYKTRRHKKGSREQTPGTYGSQADAEAAFFTARYDFENDRGKEKVNQFLAASQAERTKLEEAWQSPLRKKHKGINRSDSMTGNPKIRNSQNAGKDYNPMLPGQFNLYGSYKQNIAASTLALWCRRNTRQQAQANMTRILESQVERKRLIDSLADKVRSRAWRKLLAAAEDDEVAYKASNHDVEHAFARAKAVCRALEIQYEAVARGESMTWTECCKQASAQLHEKSEWTIARWFRDFVSREKFSEAFSWGQRGRRKDSKSYSPFACELASLLLRSWEWR